MKFILTLIATVLLLNVAQAQSDTAQTWRWGMSLQFGGYQTDFTPLRKYQYLLNQPSNFSQHVGSAAFVGNRKKLFLGISVSYSFAGVEQGTYNGYSIFSSGIYGEAGLSVYYPMYKNYSGKILRAIYPTVGGRYSMVMVQSKAEGSGVVNSDTTFFYEKSRASSYLLNTGIMFELGNFTKKTIVHDVSIVVGAGYNFQLMTPMWVGTPRYRDPGDENPDVNFGGFYFYVGVNYWNRN